MNERSSKFAVWMTILWLGGIFSFYIFGLFERPDSFNELGDFLAGVFAPVAFFWLILGYIQQGKQLNQSINALEQQRIEFEFNKASQESGCRPDLIFKPKFIQELSTDQYQFNLVIQNSGVGDALNVSVEHHNIIKKVGKIEVGNQENNIQWIIEIDDLFAIEETYNDHLKISYKNILGNNFELTKIITVNKSANRLRSQKFDVT